LTHGGGVECWGKDWEGELGIGTIARGSSIPVSVDGLSSGVAAIASGTRHTCALLKVGGVKCWGFNGEDQIGGASGEYISHPTSIEGLQNDKYLAGSGGAPVSTTTTTTTTLVPSPSSSPPCSADSLAVAARVYEQKNDDPDGTGSQINAVVCLGGYAAASYTPGNDPNTGATMAFKQAGSDWTVLGTGNVLPLNLGIPESVYAQLNQALGSNPSQQSASF
jgi:hypothetical protein